MQSLSTLQLQVLLPVVPPVVGQMPPPPVPPVEGKLSMYEQVPFASQVTVVAFGSAGQSAEVWQGVAHVVPLVPVVPVVEPMFEVPWQPPMVPLFGPLTKQLPFTQVALVPHCAAQSASLEQQLTPPVLALVPPVPVVDEATVPSLVPPLVVLVVDAAPSVVPAFVPAVSPVEPVPALVPPVVTTVVPVLLVLVGLPLVLPTDVPALVVDALPSVVPAEVVVDVGP